MMHQPVEATGLRDQSDPARSFQLLRDRGEREEAPCVLELHPAGVETLSIEAEPEGTADLGGPQGSLG